MISNKKRGSNFENEFAKILGSHGFWARLDKGMSQTCDIIAGKNNRIYMFECKCVKKDYFNMSRVEENQRYARERFKLCGNDNAWIVYKIDDGIIFLSKEFIKTPSQGLSLKDFLLSVI